MMITDLKKEKELLFKYLNNECSTEELQEIANYFSAVEYPDYFDELLEEFWKKFQIENGDNEELSEYLKRKFNHRLKSKD